MTEYPEKDLTRAIIGAAIEVQRILGPGLLESAYERCLAYELSLLGFRVETQVPIDLVYKDLKVACAFRMDLLVDDKVVVELKVAKEIAPEHEAQILSYLRFSGKTVGLILNFGVLPITTNGVRRFVLQSPSAPSA